MNDSEVLALLAALRQDLHAHPELPEHETQTIAILKAFLRAHTTLELRDVGGGFYAAHREEEAALPPLALRADFDAVPQPDGTAKHLCGHDGHSAALCGVALALEGQRLNRNVFLLFQPAEETGTGAPGCCALFDREAVSAIYGCHNIPGYPLGKVLVRRGTFACGSLGLTLTFRGTSAHAAYPEQGINPAPAIAALLHALPTLSAPERYAGMVLCTVIGARIGEKAFGSAASQGELWLTLRGERNADLQALRSAILEEAARLAQT